ncbi:ABC transporter substrate-binding protein [Castellaniella sp.]|uniref:ABC transporter substrate-binding protein n=1 Tax=Castellaniella sp. TaxID=1955812 RepID=UPI003C75E144
MRNFLKKALYAVSCLCLAAGASAASAQTQVRIGSSVHSIFALPIYYADQKGLFKEEGLDVKVSFFAGGPPAVAALLGGSVDFIAASLENQMKVNKRGEDIRSVMTVQADFSGALAVREEVVRKLGRKPTIADMKGLRIGTLSRGGYADMAARYLLQTAGVEPDKDATLIPIRGFDKVLAAGEAGSIDAALLVEPWPTLAVEGSKTWAYVVDMASGEGPDVFQDMGYLTFQTTGATLQERPDVVSKVVRAMARAMAVARDPARLDELVEVALVEFPNFKVEELRRSIEKQQHSFRPALTPQMITKNMELLLANDAITQPAPTQAEAFAEGMAPL